MDAHTWQPFRPDYTARQLDIRFKLEEERAAQGLPPIRFYRFIV